MTRPRLRWLGVGLLASAGASLLGVESMLNAAFAYGDDTALIMGDALMATPDQPYVTEVMDLFINPSPPFFQGQPVFPGYTPVIQYTPESGYGQGLTEGVTDLNQGITQQLADGNKVVVFGYSESTAVATQEMINLDNLPADQQPNPADLRFVLVEDVNNPDGGTLESSSIPGLSLPVTPADTPYTTDIYTIEYSGASDFPQYPLNLVADLNALSGYVDLHPFLEPGYPTTFNISELSEAVREPTSPGYDGATEYFLIPTQNLPLLDGLRDIPGVGPALADSIQPDLRVIVDLGYNWTGYANVDDPVEFSSPSVDWTTVSAELAAGAQQGWTAAMVDLGLLPESDLPDAYPYLPDVSGLESGLLDTGVSASSDTSASSTLLGDLGLSTLLTDLNTYLPSAANELTNLFANPFDFLSI
jgi:diacyltrehalose acyltransferase